MEKARKRAELRAREAQIEARLAVVRAARSLASGGRPPPGHRSQEAVDRHETMRGEERRLLAELDAIDRELATL